MAVEAWMSWTGGFSTNCRKESSWWNALSGVGRQAGDDGGGGAESGPCPQGT